MNEKAERKENGTKHIGTMQMSMQMSMTKIGQHVENWLSATPDL